MHESFFGLQKRPFLTVPTLERYCPVASQEQAFQNCHRIISRAEGPLAILGGTGLGKSMVCLRVAEAFRRMYEVILLSSSQICSRRALLQSLLFELRMPYRDLNEGELRLSLMDRLQFSNENPSDGLVLIVDEAQTLSIKLLDELRMLTNLCRDGVPRVRLVLCGTHRLDEMLGHPQLESLNQRLAARCYLSPLNQQETIGYLTHKIERCGASIYSVLTDEAMQLIYRATDGVPRLIDQLADQTLRLGAETRQRPCSAPLVENAWAGLQQLPLPWSDTGSPIAPASSTIEFGQLHDEHEEEFSLVDMPTSREPASAPIDQSIASKSKNFFLDSFPEQASYEPFADDTPSNSDPEANEIFNAPPSQPLPTPAPLSFDPWSDFPLPAESVSLQRAGIELVPEKPANPSASQVEPLWLPNTIDFNPESFQIDWTTTPVGNSTYGTESPIANSRVSPQPTANSFQSFVAPPLSPSLSVPSLPIQSFRQPVSHVALNSVPVPAPSQPSTTPSYEQLFGTGFSEEQSIELNGPTSSQPYLPYAGDQIVNANSIPVFEVDSFPMFSNENSSEPYAQLLDSLSSTNMEAMTFDPNVALREISNYQQIEASNRPSAAVPQYSSQAKSSILSFAAAQDSAPVVADDRDLLVIEEDIPNQPYGVATEPTTPAVVHPYKQLFSRLRG